MSQTKRVKDTVTCLAQIMTPNDANVLGNVFGGSILAMLDLTASATSQKFAGTVCVTAAFERVDFHTPIEVGNLVTMEGRISYAGRTSVEVTIEVTSTNLATGESQHSNTARVIMVAMRDSKPVEVPLLVCETRNEKLAFLAGRLRRELRQARVKQLQDLEDKLAELSESELDRLVEDRNALVLPQLG